MLSIFQKHKFSYLFKVLDKDGSGTLTKDDFIQIFAAMVPEGDEAKAKQARKAARRWWLVLKLYADKNKDNQITIDEWLAWAAGSKVEGVTESKAFTRWAEAAFATMANGDNEVTEAEFRAFATAFGFGEEADAIFFALDANGNGKFNRDEFKLRANEFFTSDIPAGNYLFGNPL